MAVQYANGKIVTDGLVLALDAADKNSYPGSGTTWRDVSGNNRNGTFAGGANYSSNYGGVVNFDGINSTVNLGTGNTFFPLNSFTTDIWFQSKGTVPTTATQPGLFGFTYGIRLAVNSTNLTFYVSSGSAFSPALSTNDSTNYRDSGIWYNVVCQATPTNTYIYVNGNLKNSASFNWLGTTVWPTNTWNLGRDNNISNLFFTGSIASHRLYNRALSTQEIQQNYNTQKSRFGLT
jgi:hypothetical protein